MPVKETAAGKVRLQTDSPKFKTLSPLIKTHVSSIQVLLSQLSDAATLRHTLQSFEPLLPYLLQYRKLLKTIVRSIGGIWGDNSADEATRISAFLILRRLMVVGDAGIKESVLKSTYEGVVKGSRNVTEVTLPAVNLMKNSAAELWGIDQKVSYSVAFNIHTATRHPPSRPYHEAYQRLLQDDLQLAICALSRLLVSSAVQPLQPVT